MVTLRFDHALAWLAKVTTAARHGALKIKTTVQQPIVALYSTSSKTWGPANDDDLTLTTVARNNNNVSVFTNTQTKHRCFL
jgi:hypothetical protein